jgi:hypothetical protein
MWLSRLVQFKNNMVDRKKKSKNKIEIYKNDEINRKKKPLNPIPYLARVYD